MARNAAVLALIVIVATLAVIAVPVETKEGGGILVYNNTEKTILARTVIEGPIYGTLAVTPRANGTIPCEYVWYTVEIFEANNNRLLCSTGSPVNVYCGNAVVFENYAGDYRC